jgi:hypothetical protein
MRWLRARLRCVDGEAGLTLVELLVASAMSVIIVGAACMMLISAVHDQPKLSKKAQEISTARYVLERMTREIRNGIQVYPGATDSKVEFETQVRRTECGGAVQSSETAAAIPCRVTYSCAATSPATVPVTYTCSRAETDPEAPPGATTPTTTIVSGLTSDSVFNYEPNVEEPSYVGVTLHIEGPEGEGALTVTDGAGLRVRSYLD